VQSALILIQRKRKWDEHGCELLARLQQVGIAARCPQDGVAGGPPPRRAEARGAGAAASPLGRPRSARRSPREVRTDAALAEDGFGGSRRVSEDIQVHLVDDPGEQRQEARCVRRQAMFQTTTGNPSAQAPFGEPRPRGPAARVRCQRPCRELQAPHRERTTAPSAAAPTAR
ncbi:unnamed protein product, partial [Prorocentrum cordatum]